MRRKLSVLFTYILKYLNSMYDLLVKLFLPFVSESTVICLRTAQSMSSSASFCALTAFAGLVQYWPYCLWSSVAVLLACMRNSASRTWLSRSLSRLEAAASRRLI